MFSLNQPIISKDFYGLNFYFYFLQKNGSNFLIGQTSKPSVNFILDKVIKNREKMIFFWNIDEFNEINSFISQNRFLTLMDWILVRILLKFGLNFYFQIQNKSLKLTMKNILLKKNIWKKPIIQILTEENLTEVKNIPNISISHSKENIFIVLYSNHVGLDVELITDHSSSWKKKIFSKIEKENFFTSLKSINTMSKVKIYTLMWSIKESTLKIENGYPLGLISKISIEIKDNKISSIIPGSPHKHQNYFTIFGNSILSLTI